MAAGRTGSRTIIGALLLATGCVAEPSGPADTTSAPPASSGRTSEFPEEWGGTSGFGAYTIGLDAAAHGGAKAAYIKSAIAHPPESALLSQYIRADDYRGKRVRWSAWVRPANVEKAGLLMRVDGYTRVLAFDNMTSRAITGTSDWHQVSIVLDVAPGAAGIQSGIYLRGGGDVVIDDMTFEVVNSSVPVTETMTDDVILDSASTDLFYAGMRPAFVNTNFEGVSPPDAAAVAWLQSNSSVLLATEPALSLSDLAPLGDMIGDAHIVGLGEGTHGTREFFQMKHRIFRYLVEQKQFTHFAIEAAWPEANEINRYVLSGAGNPAQLIRSLHFWIWDTSEVLALVQWMRQWNLTAAENRRVQFLGFDMLYPGLALDTVAAFVQRTSPGNLTFVNDRLRCIIPYRNHDGTFERNPNVYATLPEAQKTACRDSVSQVHRFLADNEVTLEQASSDEEHARALQSARAVQQFEEWMAFLGSSSSAVRDRAMAENVDWLLGRAGPGTRMALWAHNGHVGRTSTAMGGVLADRHGSDYRNLGFLFGKGTLRAVNMANGRLEVMSATVVPRLSMEAYFGAAGHANAVFDARKLLEASAPSALRTIRMRSIGSLFHQSAEASFYVSHRFPERFDLLVYIGNASATRLP